MAREGSCADVAVGLTRLTTQRSFWPTITYRWGCSYNSFGLGPKGNTGGTNVSPFKAMPIKPAFQTMINNAKSSR